MPIIHRVVTYIIAAVWLANGLLCTVFNLVPRHQLIVARRLGSEYAAPLTRLIGVAELGMAAWVVSRVRPRWCAATQVLLVAAMNTLEFFLAPDLLLFGHLNALYAALFIGLIIWHEWARTQPAALTRTTE